ncbi:hypothetical protein NQ176_g2714 [Zarea fungicola]|uniref:Uncharacterized protein n=1 Tax=Zarea fungicola TaxID=93591 RepID=A0ACC1NMJ8_9HYPO|nr:hypothetical protein NQ176_g2714 [Lecanicillium fungicola]
MQDNLLLRLQCGVNSKIWGKVGHESMAARFAATTTPDLQIELNRPYAELWAGTYPSNPCKDVASGRSLIDLIAVDASLLSTSVKARYGSRLPFLLKILSIGKPLSIQAHPNKRLAEQLRSKYPDIYPDDNHKPEMAIALSDFEGLCGIRPLEEMAHFLTHVPSFRMLVGDHSAQLCFAAACGGGLLGSAAQNALALQSAFTALLAASPDSVTAATRLLVAEASSKVEEFAGGGVKSTSGAVLAELVARLYMHFPDDVGIFFIFFLNHVRLSPGEAVFLKADTIHAYLSGDIIECMAASDNVVRAGLTHNFKDTDAFTQLFEHAVLEEPRVDAKVYARATLNQAAINSASQLLLYDPPVDEFSIVRSVLIGHGAKATLDPISGPLIAICTSGSGRIAVGPTRKEIKEGWVYFLGANSKLDLECIGTETNEFTTFIAFCEGGGA